MSKRVQKGLGWNFEEKILIRGLCVRNRVGLFLRSPALKVFDVLHNGRRQYRLSWVEYSFICGINDNPTKFRVSLILISITEIDTVKGRTWAQISLKWILLAEDFHKNLLTCENTLQCLINGGHDSWWSEVISKSEHHRGAK